MNNVSKWMSWEGGIDLVALTSPDFQMPNLIVHLARMVNTPIGCAASGMILWQPDPQSAPAVMGFVSDNQTVGEYFGPNIFADTPFEFAPVLKAEINIDVTKDKALAVCKVGNYTFEVDMTDFSDPYLIDRTPSAMPPFYQQGVEIHARKTVVKINGEAINLIIPPVGITGGPASVVSPNGVYAR
ncbi:hypothetical protein EZJ43_15830 [Pedobacter changchengzhani]|uniref:Uncharacterized protein n=1 Tax=Pedobacter changchengzhani TaxID=2529274 RepID=A0A4R5MI90_9SPHI|nr:hypothetical protein [Pedobacter changchengzhani]TDG35036.1 hypothetical protein EZJ43_15830 [Pedobacter changchengzhani]